MYRKVMCYRCYVDLGTGTTQDKWSGTVPPTHTPHPSRSPTLVPGTSNTWRQRTLADCIQQAVVMNDVFSWSPPHSLGYHSKRRFASWEPEGVTWPGPAMSLDMTCCNHSFQLPPATHGSCLQPRRVRMQRKHTSARLWCLQMMWLADTGQICTSLHDIKWTTTRSEHFRQIKQHFQQNN